MKRKWLFFLGLLLLLLSLSSLASAANPTMTLEWTVEGYPVTVSLFEKKTGEQYLFLPAAVKGKDPVLRMTPEDNALIWDGVTYENGSVFPAESFIGLPTTASFRSGRRLGTVTVMQGSAIPALFFSIPPEEYNRILKGTHLDIRQPGSLVMLTGEGALETAQTIPSFKTRGNSTFFTVKKAYQFTLESKAPLCGMEKNKKWILLANMYDISLIRNQMTFDLLREVGLTSTPDCFQVDLYVNGAYLGTFLLTEKIQLKKGRLEITDLEETLEELNGREVYDRAAFKHGNGGVVKVMKWFDLPLEPEDVSGGYLLEIEKALQFSQLKDGAGFVTDGKMCVVVKEPTHVGIRGLQYITALVNDFHNAVLAKDGINKTTGRHYSSYIDMRSFALKIITEEFTENYDVRAASQFMYKDADSVDSRLYAGPGWDYDLSYGNKNDGARNPLKQDYVLKKSSNTAYLYHWLLLQDDFKIITRQLYDEVFLPAAEVLAGRREPAEGSPLRSVRAYQDAIRASAQMNFTRWTARAIPDVWDGSGRTFEDAGAWVQSWVEQRLDLLTATWLLEN